MSQVEEEAPAEETNVKTTTDNSTDEITPDESSPQAPGAGAASAADQHAEAKRLAEERAAQRAKEQQSRIAEMKALEEEANKLFNVPSEMIKSMSEGLIGLNEEDIKKIAEKLHALQNAQTALIERLAQEDRKVMTLPNMAEVAQALAHVPLYTKKLEDMRKDMDSITNRVKGMRKRAAKLYTKKQQEDNSAAQRRQAELLQEKKSNAAASEGL